MKSVKNDGNTTTYPKLVIYPTTGNIVLLCEKGKGIPVHSLQWPIGEYSEGWAENYRLYTGSITLSND